MPLSSPHAWGSGSWGGLAFPGASGAGGRATGPRGAKDLVLGAVVQPPNREVGVRVQGPGDCPTHSSSARHSHTHSELGRRTLHRLPDAPSEGGLPQNAPLHFHALRPQARLAFSSCSLRLLQGGPSPHLLGASCLGSLRPRTPHGKVWAGPVGLGASGRRSDTGQRVPQPTSQRWGAALPPENCWLCLFLSLWPDLA